MRETDIERAKRMIAEYGRENAIDLLQRSIGVSQALRTRLPVSRKFSVDAAIAADQHMIACIEGVSDNG